MGDFKEWLSDNLRYFLVGVVVILIIGGSILGLKIYSSAVNGKKEPEIWQESEIQSESETKKETESDTEADTESEKETQSESETESETQTQSTQETSSENTTIAEAPSKSDQSDYDYEQPSYQEVPQSETVQTEPPKPVYMTINSACYMRSYADYGDNIIGQFEAGTTVQFLEDVGGWYKVSVNGQTGYIGARFFY